MAPIYLSGLGWWGGWGGWLYSDYNASLSPNWTELDWTGTELGNIHKQLFSVLPCHGGNTSYFYPT